MINNNNLPQTSEIINLIIKRFKSYDFIINGLIEGVQTLTDEIVEIKTYCDNDQIGQYVNEAFCVLYYLILASDTDFINKNFISCEIHKDHPIIESFCEFENLPDYDFSKIENPKGSLNMRITKLEEQTEQMTDLLLSIQKRLDLIEIKLTPPDTFDAEIID